MSRQAKIIIFSIILVFVIYQKQTKEEKKPSNSIDTSKYNKKNKTGIYDNLGLTNSPVIFYPKPKNGYSPYDKYFGKGIYDNNTGNEFIIKNSNQTDAVVLLVNAYSGRKVRNEFVAKGTNFKMTGVPNGTYYLEWFSGNDWSPNLKVSSKFKGGFQSKVNFTKTKDRSDWMNLDGYKQWTVTLYSVVGGDVESENINADDFFN